MVSNALIKFDFPRGITTIRFSLLSASRLELELGSGKESCDNRFAINGKEKERKTG